ncbi:Uncharacterized protein T11_16248 [Trichinella zimbabwensis]|uniref:Uncharacterized protein n=1 Tax=Trichinella zimbabwensis TaxID=268475 RepID=A0A0V1HKS5_9BILA|nr:Uncharacterized protein T11_16248 [Trichinella zimbabwensis]
MMAVGELIGESSASAVGRLATDQTDPAAAAAAAAAMDDELVRRVDSYLLNILDDDGAQDIDSKPSQTLLSTDGYFFTASEHDEPDSISPVDRSSLSYGSLGEAKHALGSNFDVGSVASLSSSSRSSSAPAAMGGDSSPLLSLNLSPVLEQLVRLEIEQGTYNDNTTAAATVSASNTANNNNDNYYKYYCQSWSNSNTGTAFNHNHNHNNNNNNNASVWPTGEHNLFNQRCAGYDGWNTSGSSCGGSTSSCSSTGSVSSSSNSSNTKQQQLHSSLFYPGNSAGGDSVWSPAGIWKEPKLGVTINGTTANDHCTATNGINSATNTTRVGTTTTAATTTATTTTTTTTGGGWLFGDNWDSPTRQQPSVVKIDSEPPRYVSCYMSPSQKLACEQMANEMARRRAMNRMAPLLPMAVNPVLAPDGAFGFLAPRPTAYYQDDLLTMKEIYCRNGNGPVAPLWSGVPFCYEVPPFGAAAPQPWYPLSSAYHHYQHRPYYGPLKGGNRRNDSLLDLHLSYDECFEEFRLLEKDRKKTEAELARHNLGKKINSSNNIPIPRLPVAPSRIDRMLIDYFREHARVITLLQKMEWLRSETLNSRIYEAVRAWFSAMKQLQTLRITERNTFIRNFTPVQEELDVSNTANALKVLTKTVRRARTAMACSLILTVNVQLTAEQQEMVSKFLGADALAEMLMSSKVETTKSTAIADKNAIIVAERENDQTAPQLPESNESYSSSSSLAFFSLFTAFSRQQLPPTPPSFPYPPIKQSTTTHVKYMHNFLFSFLFLFLFCHIMPF